MHNALRILVATAAVTTLSLTAPMPLIAGRGTPAGKVAAPVSVDPLELMTRAIDLPVQQIEDLSTIY